MQHASIRVSDWVIAGAIPLVLVAALPLVALVAFVLRPVLLLAIALALGATLVHQVLHARRRSSAGNGPRRGNGPPSTAEGNRS